MDEHIRTNREILARLERLERENRKLKRGALMGAAMAACLIAFFGLLGQAQQTPTTQQKTPAARAKKPPRRLPAPAPAPPPAPFVMPKNIEAESFVLKDSSGRVRAELAMSGEGPSLKLREPKRRCAGDARAARFRAGAARFSCCPTGSIRSNLSMKRRRGPGLPTLSLIGERAGHSGAYGRGSGRGTTLELSDKGGFTNQHWQWGEGRQERPSKEHHRRFDHAVQ